MFRDLERLAVEFARELRTAAWHTESVGENALSDLRTILEETLSKVRDEVFGGAAEGSAPGSETPGSETPGSEAPGSRAPGSKAAGPEDGAETAGAGHIDADDAAEPGESSEPGEDSKPGDGGDSQRA